MKNNLRIYVWIASVCFVFLAPVGVLVREHVLVAG